VSFAVNSSGAPSASDLIYSIPTGHTYDKTARGIGAVTGKPGVGAITVKYNGQTTLPVNAGSYTVTADVAAGAGFEAGAAISLGTYTIAPRGVTVASGTVTATKVYDATATFTTDQIDVRRPRGLPSPATSTAPTSP
jgi:hypothetical protein